MYYTVCTHRREKSDAVIREIDVYSGEIKKKVAQQRAIIRRAEEASWNEDERRKVYSEEEEEEEEALTRKAVMDSLGIFQRLSSAARERERFFGRGEDGKKFVDAFGCGYAALECMLYTCIKCWRSYSRRMYTKTCCNKIIIEIYSNRSQSSL